MEEEKIQNISIFLYKNEDIIYMTNDKNISNNTAFKTMSTLKNLK
jgi:hypothetical protein